MRTKMFFMLPALALAFASCSNDDEGYPTTNFKGEPAVLTISLAGENQDVNSKASGPEGSAESTVTDGIIYVFDGDGNVIKKAFFKSGDFTASPTTKTINTTTAAKSVSVLLNVGVSDSASLVTTPYDVPTKTQLNALTVQLATTNGTGTATQLNNKLYMSGESTGTFTFTGTPVPSASVDVTVSRIASRVKINWTFAPNSTYTNKIRLTGAVILNARSASKLFGSPLYQTSGTYIQGITQSIFDGLTTTAYKPTANNIFNPTLLSVSPFAVPQVLENYFYIFENASTYPTIVAITADYNENGIDVGTNQKKYYPIVINRATTGNQTGLMTIVRNVQYVVSATVKGVGVDNPFEPVDPAVLNVKVIVAPWALTITANQTFE